MHYFELISGIVIFLLCLITFVYSLGKIFRKETSKFFIFLCLADLCYAVEELCAFVYAVCGYSETDSNFQVSILGTISVFLFLLTASFAVLDKLIVKNNENKKARLLALSGPFIVLVSYICCLYSCLKNNIPSTIVTLTFLMLPLFVFSYFALKHLLLKNKQEVCKKTFKCNLLLVIFCITNLLYTITYLMAPVYVNLIISIVNGVEIAILPIICVKESKVWEI